VIADVVKVIVGVMVIFVEIVGLLQNVVSSVLIALFISNVSSYLEKYYYPLGYPCITSFLSGSLAPSDLIAFSTLILVLLN
jgi:hypothetical protein